MRKAYQPMAVPKKFTVAESYETTIQRIRRQRNEQKAVAMYQAKEERRGNARFMLDAFLCTAMVVGGLAGIYFLYVFMWLIAG